MHHKNCQCKHSRSDMHWLSHSGSSAVAGLRVADRQSHCVSFVGTLSGSSRCPTPQTFWAAATNPTAIQASLSSHWCWLNASSQKWEIQVKRQGYIKIFQIWVAEVAEIPVLEVASTWIEAGSQMPLVHQLLFDLLTCLRNAKSSTRAAWYKCWVTGWAEVWGIPKMETQQQRGRRVPSPSFSPQVPVSMGAWSLLEGNKSGGGRLAEVVQLSFKLLPCPPWASQ